MNTSVFHQQEMSLKPWQVKEDEDSPKFNSNLTKRTKKGKRGDITANKVYEKAVKSPFNSGYLPARKPSIQETFLWFRLPCLSACRVEGGMCSKARGVDGLLF